MKLKKIQWQIPVSVKPEKMWEILSQYGNVSQFHAGVVESHKQGGSTDTASLGCERVCNIVDMGIKIVLKERIIEYQEGLAYKYEVYEWKNFPIQKMFFRFSVDKATQGRSLLGIEIEYKARPALLTPLLAGKMKKLACNVLLGYKHFAETGKKRVAIKELQEKYRLAAHLAESSA